MNLKNYCENNKKKFEIGGGLPEGDSFFSKDAEVKEVIKEFDGKEKTLWEITSIENKKYIIGKGVMNGISQKISLGHEYIRVTRSGKSRTDTRYTYLGVSDIPKSIVIEKESH